MRNFLLCLAVPSFLFEAGRTIDAGTCPKSDRLDAFVKRVCGGERRCLRHLQELSLSASLKIDLPSKEKLMNRTDSLDKVLLGFSAHLANLSLTYDSAESAIRIPVKEVAVELTVQVDALTGKITLTNLRIPALDLSSPGLRGGSWLASVTSLLHAGVMTAMKLFLMGPLERYVARLIQGVLDRRDFFDYV